MSENGLSTKGDNSQAPDNLTITSENLNGKVIYYTNILANYLNFYHKHGIFITLILPIIALILLIISLKWIIKRIQQKSTPKSSSTTP